jgi:hypothetical protein
LRSIVRALTVRVPHCVLFAVSLALAIAAFSLLTSIGCVEPNPGMPVAHTKAAAASRRAAAAERAAAQATAAAAAAADDVEVSSSSSSSASQEQEDEWGDVRGTQQQQQQQPLRRNASASSRGGASANAAGTKRVFFRDASPATASPTSRALAAWLQKQATVNATTYVELTERVRDSGSTRTILLRLSGTNAFHSWRGETIMNAAALAGESVKLKPGSYCVKVRVFRNCVVLACSDVHVKPSHPTFPLCPETRWDESAELVGIRLVPDAEAVRIIEADNRARLAVDAEQLVNDPDAARERRANNDKWSRNENVFHHAATIESILREMYDGVYVPLMKRATEGPTRHAWRDLAGRCIDGYATCTDPVRKTFLIKALIAFPRMFGRRLQGKASQDIRKKYERAQLDLLSPAMCVETNPPQRPAGETPMISEADFDRRCVQRAYRLAKQGEFSRARAALEREQVEPAPPDQRLVNLRELHPTDVLPEMDGYAANQFPYSAEKNIKTEDIKKHLQACASAAPGPDGWTGESLGDALELPSFAKDFTAIVVDICNGNVDASISQLLTTSTLVGIPKSGGGTRPLSMGSTILKSASACSTRASEPEFKKVFAGSQFGVGAKGGGDTIIHVTRRFVQTGQRYGSDSYAPDTRCIVTLDAKNAFNSVTRASIWAAIRAMPALHGIFGVSYGAFARLNVQGMKGEYIESKRGTRQGDVAGVTLFALAIQSAINAANAIPGVTALAYLDDVTLLADSPQAAAAATTAFKNEFARIGMVLNEKKCELLFACVPAASITTDLVPENSPLAPFKKTDALKLLGASIARDPNLERQHLNERMRGKNATFFRRLSTGPSPQLLQLLRLCGIPKLGHAIRVHSPEVVCDVARDFDAMVLSVPQAWSGSVPFGPRERLLLQLPRALGGLGLTSQEAISHGAYRASFAAALERGIRMPRQGQISDLMYRRVVESAKAEDPTLERTLAYNALPGADAAIFNATCSVHPDVYSALLRLYLGTHTPAAAAKAQSDVLECPGCHARYKLSSGEWNQHTIGCTRMQGGPVVRRHNVCAQWLRRKMRDAEMNPDMREPRDLRRYTCQCGAPDMSHSDFVHHRSKTSCPHARKQALHSSGPDILYEPGTLGAKVAADFTVRNPMNKTHVNEPFDRVFDSAIAEKKQLYDALCSAAGVTFQVLPAFANGHLGPELDQLLHRLSKQLMVDRNTLRGELSALVARHSAATLLHAERALRVQPPTLDHVASKLAATYLQQVFPDAAADGSRQAAPAARISADYSSPEAIAALVNRLVDARWAQMLEALQTAGVDAVDKITEEHLAKMAARDAQRADDHPLLEPADETILPMPELMRPSQEQRRYAADIRRRSTSLATATPISIAAAIAGENITARTRLIVAENEVARKHWRDHTARATELIEQNSEAKIATVEIAASELESAAHALERRSRDLEELTRALQERISIEREGRLSADAACKEARRSSDARTAKAIKRHKEADRAHAAAKAAHVMREDDVKRSQRTLDHEHFLSETHSFSASLDRQSRVPSPPTICWLGPTPTSCDELRLSSPYYNVDPARGAVEALERDIAPQRPGLLTSISGFFGGNQSAAQPTVEQTQVMTEPLSFEDQQLLIDNQQFEKAISLNQTAFETETGQWQETVGNRLRASQAPQYDDYLLRIACGYVSHSHPFVRQSDIAAAEELKQQLRDSLRHHREPAQERDDDPEYDDSALSPTPRATVMTASPVRPAPLHRATSATPARHSNSNTSSPLQNNRAETRLSVIPVAGGVNAVPTQQQQQQQPLSAEEEERAELELHRLLDRRPSFVAHSRRSSGRGSRSVVVSSASSRTASSRSTTSTTTTALPRVPSSSDVSGGAQRIATPAGAAERGGSNDGL